MAFQFVIVFKQVAISFFVYPSEIATLKTLSVLGTDFQTLLLYLNLNQITRDQNQVKKLGRFMYVLVVTKKQTWPKLSLFQRIYIH